MNVQKLVRMANQIAENFEYGDQEKAIAGIADHLSRFWTAAMKRQLLAHAATGESGLSPLATAAVERLTDSETA